MKSTFVIGAIALTTLLLPSLIYAADMAKERRDSNRAEANFLTNTGCEDVSVGASVTEVQTKTKGTPRSEPTRTLQVFGSIVDNCEFGSSWSFFGTTSVTDAEFVQHGTDDATLTKTFFINGTEIALSLQWEGVGVIGGEDEVIKTNENGVRVTKKWDVDSRNAEMTGTFVVNGLNRIDDSSLVNAELEVVKMVSKTKTK